MVLIIPGFWICLRLWIYQGSEYISVLNMPRFWVYLWFWIYKGSEYAVILQVSEYLWIIPEYVKLCLNMPEYAGICLNGFYFTFPTVISCLLGLVVTFFQRLHDTRNYSVKEHEGVFLKRQNWIFSLVTGSISFNFCFRQNIFTNKISNLLLPLQPVALILLYLQLRV